MVLQLAFLIAMPANAEIGYFNDTDETEVEEVIELEKEEQLEKEQQEQQVTTDENQEQEQTQEQKIIKEEVKTEPIKLNVEKTDLQEIIAPQEQEELPLKKKQNPLNLLKDLRFSRTEVSLCKRKTARNSSTIRNLPQTNFNRQHFLRTTKPA